MAIVLEVIVQSVEDARAAEAGGADRLEVVRDIDRDGLTPALELVRAITSETTRPLRVIVRENAGFALGGAQELTALQRAMAALDDMRVDGVVLGFVRDRSLDLEAIDAVMAAGPHLNVTLHRAFDAVEDPFEAIVQAQGRPRIDRILSSGGSGPAVARCKRLAEYASAAGNRPIILAGGGLDEALIRELVWGGYVREVHVGRAARVSNSSTGPVSAEQVRHLREICDG